MEKLSGFIVIVPQFFSFFMISGFDTIFSIKCIRRYPTS